MWSQIPAELKHLPQWVCAYKDKIPINARTGELASVVDPQTWCSFEEATQSGAPYIGFVLTKNDPYCIIDLDDKVEKPASEQERERHRNLLEAFQSYTEKSTSGLGYHIVIKGRTERGARRDNVEVYSAERYMIFTGDIVRNAPIKDYQELLDQLFAEMQPITSGALIEQDITLSDEEVFNTALNASNGDKFDTLCRGEWESLGYASQSEADFALMSILAFYSRSNDQVRRLFRYSALGKRDKAQRDAYLDYALRKIRTNEPPPIDFTEFQPSDPSTPTAPPTETSHRGPVEAPEGSLPPPPGLVGELQQYIQSTATRPVSEVALVGALALLAGITGRSYNISGTGLNQYLVLLARTGAGKEGAQNGIDRIISAVRPRVPMADQFIGPSAFASGQALIKALDERPCFVSVLGEFGITLQQISDPRANGALTMLKKVFLDLYTKSGFDRILRSSVYADSEKNTKVIQAPNVTILGESTPETFFEGLNTHHIAEGLVPRFSVVEYSGPRPPRNKNSGGAPSEALVDRIAELITIALTTTSNHTVQEVAIDQQAETMLDELDEKADREINKHHDTVHAQLWNRVHLKALKMAGLLAVGSNPHHPIVTTVEAEWAIQFVEQDVQNMLGRFDRDEVGSADDRLSADIERIVEEYLESDSESRRKYKVLKSLRCEKAPVIPFDYIRRRARRLTAFQQDKRGVSRALREELQTLMDAGVLTKLPEKDAWEKFHSKGVLYVKGN